MAGLDKPMEQALGVPVLDGVVCTVKLAEGAGDYGLRLSKVKAYQEPEPKTFKGLHGFRME